MLDGPSSQRVSAIERRKNVSVGRSARPEAPGDASRHNALGVRYIEDQRLELRGARFEAAIRLAPNNAEALHNLGQCLRMQGQPAAALARLSSAPPELRPGNPLDSDEPGGCLGGPRPHRGSHQPAPACGRARWPPADAHNNLGATLASLGRIDEAIDHFQAAVRLRPGDPDAARNLDQARAVQAAADAPNFRSRSLLPLNTLILGIAY